MSTASVAAGSGAQSLAVDPLGRYVYVANGAGNNVSQYTIGANGALTPMSTVAAGTGPQSIAVDPSGVFVYVANLGSSDVSQYAIGLNGTLTPLTPPTAAAGTNPRSIIAVGRYE
jgi:DNA-binding beta-propeller fold protein YncE